VVALLVGCLVLAGWALDIAVLKSIVLGFATMKSNTSLCFVLAGAALWALAGAGADRRRQTLAAGAAAVVVLIGALTLGEYIFGINLGIDELLFVDYQARATTVAPGRMSPATALNFLLIGVTLLLLRTRRADRLSQTLILVTLLSALLALLGYAYGAASLYRIAAYSTMAIHTATAFAILCVGMLYLRPEQGLVGLLADPGIAGRQLRLLLPAVIGVPFVFGWLRLIGQRAGLYDTTFGVAILVASTVVALVGLTWYSARKLQAADAARRQADDEIRRLNELLEQRVRERTAELTAANEQLAQANITRSRFFANMSHELRTPLNAIIGFTGVLLMKLPGPLNADQEQQLTRVQSSARHLLALIEDVLEVTRIESGTAPLTREPVSCQDVAREVATALQPLAKEKGLALEIIAPPEDLIILADRRALRQILYNLISNAIKFTEHGSVRIEIGRRNHGGRPAAALSVHDTGIGIRREDYDKLFQAFMQADQSSTRRYEGTGLGLYLSLKLALAMGGEIEYSSEFGRGSTFTLLCPEE
jgi:signal transduction histidine kinase